MMSVQIPISGSPRPTDPARGVTIPLGTALSVPQIRSLPIPQFGTSRGEKVVRAVAAAAALEDPSEALRLAEQAVKDPAAVADNTIERPKLDPVLERVSAALDQGGGPSPTPGQIAAARAVGADPALVAVAQEGLKAEPTGAATSEALEWVALIEPRLLAEAANAGLRQVNIDFVPKAPGSVAATRLDAIEARLKTLEDGQTAATGRLDAIEARLKTLEDGQTAATGRLDAIEARLKTLEDGKRSAKS